MGETRWRRVDVVAITADSSAGLVAGEAELVATNEVVEAFTAPIVRFYRVGNPDARATHQPHVPIPDRNGSDGTTAIGCSCGYPACDMDGFREHVASEERNRG